MPLPKTDEGLALWKQRQSIAQKGKSRNANVPRDKFGRFTWGTKNDFRKDPRKPRGGWECPVCHKVFMLLPWEIKNKKYCSHKCRATQVKNGEQSPYWRGGRTYTADGYVQIRWRENNKLNVILEHRMIMERWLGRPLAGNEIVHHRNGIKDDNRIENLEIVLRNTHNGQVRCPHCLKEFKIK